MRFDDMYRVTSLNHIDRSSMNWRNISAALAVTDDRSLKEIEEVVYDRKRNDDSRMKCLLLADKYRADTEDKNGINTLLWISKNQKVKTRIVNADTLAGKRISQFGGVIFFSMPNNKRPFACV